MVKNFIPVTEAKELIKNNCTPLQAVEIPLRKALNTVLASDVYSPVNIPGFAQSAMDGYAIAYDELKNTSSFIISGESFAGITGQLKLNEGEAIRIFTGAPVPLQADTVIMQEHVSVSNGQISITDPSNIIKGQHVRPAGSEIMQGSLAMSKGELLTAPAIGFLAGLGTTTVPVFPFPSVTIITTGKEIIQPGNELAFGQVYGSNSASLSAALQQLHLHKIDCTTVDDNITLLEKSIENAVLNSDIVLITGGVSVGDYDLVPGALKNIGLEIIFHKVQQRPGKPLLFGRKNNKLVFGLPGNPSSVLSCFYNYVVPAIQYKMNRPIPFLPTMQMKMKEAFSKKIPLTQFLKGYYKDNEVMWLGAQESFRLSSFAVSNCLIEIPAEKNMIEKDEWVTVHLI